MIRMNSLRKISLALALSLAIGWQIMWCPPAAAEGSDAIATLNGEPISREQVEERAATKLYRLRWEIYNTLKTESEALVNDLLLKQEAERKGMTVDELLDVEVDRKAPVPDSDAVDNYIKEKNVTSRSGEDMHARIAAYLTDRARIQRKLDFLAELRKKASFEFLLDPPARARANVSVDDDPMRGNPDAPITIIHFASFTCAICAESAAKIQKLTEEFPGMIRWVHRDFLNLFDERGLAAASAGETAHASGKFWAFHDHIYSFEGNFEKDEIGSMLEQVGVDPELFEQAEKDATYLMEIRHDIEDGVNAGVTGVPAIFVNGRMISGTFSYEQLKRVVEEELDAVGKADSAKTKRSPETSTTAERGD